MAELTLNDAQRLHLAEWIIILLTTPDPPPVEGELVREVAALEVISAMTQFLREGQMREGIRTALTPYASTRMEQLREQLSTKAQPLMHTEAFAGTAQGGIGLGSISEWDALAMVIAERKHRGKPYHLQSNED